ncbi:hypothetical protein Tco_0598909 [Tanacetum coccineum]
MSGENSPSGLGPQGQKAQDNDTLTPEPPRQMLFLHKKPKIHHIKKGIEILKNHLLRVARIEASSDFCCPRSTQVFSNLSDDMKRRHSNGPLKEEIEDVLNGGDEILFRTSDPPVPKRYFINQAKYALEILKKHNMDNCHSIGTPLATKPKLDVDLSGDSVDQSDYHSKIGSIMYLTSSRPDLVQAVCYCARYQA